MKGNNSRHEINGTHGNWAHLVTGHDDIKEGKPSVHGQQGPRSRGRGGRGRGGRGGRGRGGRGRGGRGRGGRGRGGRGGRGRGGRGRGGRLCKAEAAPATASLTPSRRVT
ncbi:hypothetical protein FHG87_004559 [Trinorchestia longiramus]|nr:hypothetical protein FHG87_004559 [Trinorchestia longiramus]